MPDTRSHRGAHPEDARDFGATMLPRLRVACAELSWLLGRAYSDVAALKLVGDHHQLTARQRRAVMRGAAPDEAVARRAARRRSAESLAGAAIALDGFNCLITIESMLGRAPVFVGRDGALRDLASVHGTYRSVTETEPAVTLLARALARHHIGEARILLDRPVGNSGRLRGIVERALAAVQVHARVELSDSVDRLLAEHEGPVATSDGWILDRAAAWVDLPSTVARDEGLSPWLVDFREPLPTGPQSP